MQSSYQFASAPRTRADEAMATLLRAAGRHRTFAAAAAIQVRGNDGDGFWLIERGQVKLCRVARSGELTVFGILGAGDLFGELAYFARIPRQVDAIAEAAAELVWIGAAQIDRLLATEPGFAAWLLGSLARQLRFALDRIEIDRVLSAEARLARALGTLATRDGATITATQQELADLVGVSRVTAGQVLGRFAAAGAIARGYRRITIRNRAALDAWAG